MSGAFSKPKEPELPKQEEAPVVVQEDEQEVKRRKRQAIQGKGREANILAGMQIALKKRLGE